MAQNNNNNTGTDGLIVDVATVSEIAKLVANGKCILFLGAGVHCPPPDKLPYTFNGTPYRYPEYERPPLGSKLAEELARESEYIKEFPQADSYDLQRIAWHYEISKDRNLLVQKLRREVELNKKPSPVLRALAELNFPLVCTTNYDRLLEVAFFAAGKVPDVSVYSKKREPPTDYRQADLDPQQPFIFKIHGDIARPESIVITDEDYIDFILRMGDVSLWNPVPPTVQYHFRKSPTLFIGYSLLDYNLRLLFKTLRWIGDPSGIPQSYSIDLFPDGLIRKVYSEQKKFLQYIVVNVWAFVPELYRALNNGKDMPL
jgi:hypothetical protein